MTAGWESAGSPVHIGGQRGPYGGGGDCRRNSCGQEAVRQPAGGGSDTPIAPPRSTGWGCLC